MAASKYDDEPEGAPSWYRGHAPVSGIHTSAVLLNYRRNVVNPEKILVRYDQMAEQVEGPVKRIVGFVKARNMLPLFDAADLEANPRSAKAGPVTEAIIESIVET